MGTCAREGRESLELGEVVARRPALARELPVDDAHAQASAVLGHQQIGMAHVTVLERARQHHPPEGLYRDPSGGCQLPDRISHRGHRIEPGQRRLEKLVDDHRPVVIARHGQCGNPARDCSGGGRLPTHPLVRQRLTLEHRFQENVTPRERDAGQHLRNAVAKLRSQFHKTSQGCGLAAHTHRVPLESRGLGHRAHSRPGVEEKAEYVSRLHESWCDVEHD
ncbi:unannotated protein [freshwater metagenome]|uniref:Unannotated protein n=1 Tax=freshwater metagenome TaxID=449393 RepID=A0A6J7S8T6_9ZZZZ